MNIVDAYREAKGRRIKRACRKHDFNYFNTDQGLTNFLHDLTEDAFAADDWEVERKPLVWEGEVKWETSEFGPKFTYPVSRTNHINSCSIFQFSGKLTKIRIEEILD